MINRFCFVMFVKPSLTKKARNLKKRQEKFDKKVTWSEKLTEIKMITPQPSKFENLTEIVFSEEEEDILNEDKEHCNSDLVRTRCF